MSEYINFVEIKDTGKTKVWIIETKSGDMVGKIHWYARWRQYTFEADDIGIEWSAGCLQDIVDFIKKQMEDRRK